MNRPGPKLVLVALLLAALVAIPQPVVATTPSTSAIPTFPDLKLSGTVMIGDSITWRSAPMLRQRHPDWYIDGDRGRPVKALGPRLRHYQRRVNPTPANFIMALGSNRSVEPPWSKRRYLHALRTLPDETNLFLMMVVRTGRFQAWKDVVLRKYNRWSRQIARSRPNTYVIPWRTAVLRDPTLNRRTGRSSLIEDGVHPTGPAGVLGRSRVVGPGVETFVWLIERAVKRADRHAAELR